LPKQHVFAVWLIKVNNSLYNAVYCCFCCYNSVASQRATRWQLTTKRYFKMQTQTKIAKTPTMPAVKPTPAVVTTFNIDTINFNNPASTMATFCATNFVYIVNKATPTLAQAKMLVGGVYGFGTRPTQGTLAILMLLGIVKLVATTNTYKNTASPHNGKFIYKCVLNTTGNPTLYTTPTTKQHTSVGGQLALLMGQTFGNSGKSHCALVALLTGGIHGNGYNVVPNGVAKHLAQHQALLAKYFSVVASSTVPTAHVKHNTDTLTEYQPIVNSLIAKMPLLTK
tara:strand:- start:620 stop:1465 length:846 start_codon:yes stop_codon:yes gene_type:complete